MTAKTAFTKIYLALSILVLSLGANQALSQAKPVITRIAVTVDQKSTNIWISDFPAHQTLMLVDADNNLLALISTNDYGAGFTKLNKPVLSTITARTLNGEISVYNKAITKEATLNTPAAVINQKPDTKA